MSAELKKGPQRAPGVVSTKRFVQGLNLKVLPIQTGKIPPATAIIFYHIRLVFTRSGFGKLLVSVVFSVLHIEDSVWGLQENPARFFSSGIPVSGEWRLASIPPVYRLFRRAYMKTCTITACPPALMLFSRDEHSAQAVAVRHALEHQLAICLAEGFDCFICVPSVYFGLWAVEFLIAQKESGASFFLELALMQERVDFSQSGGGADSTPRFQNILQKAGGLSLNCANILDTISPSTVRILTCSTRGCNPLLNSMHRYCARTGIELKSQQADDR